MQEADVYLFDDVLAAVDPAVATWLLDHAICGRLLQGRTQVLCTHSTAALDRADFKCRLQHGMLAAFEATPHDDKTSGGSAQPRSDLQGWTGNPLSSPQHHTAG